MSAKPEKAYETFQSKVLPELKASGLMGQAELDQLETQVKALQSTYQGYALSKKIASTLALFLGGYVTYKGVSGVL